MWQRFTERARKVVFYAQEEAGKLGQSCVLPEHFLLGLLHETECAGVTVLQKLGVSLDRLRAAVMDTAERGADPLGRDMMLGPGSKRLIDHAHNEARQLGHDFIGTEHLLLGMIREGDGAAARALDSVGVKVDAARREAEALPTDRRDASVPGSNGRSTITTIASVSRFLQGRGGTSTASHHHPAKHDSPLRTEVDAATRLASILGQTHVMPVHLAVVLLSDPPDAVIRLLGQFDVDAQALLVQFPEADATTPAAKPTSPTLSYESGYVLTRAVEKAWGLFHESIVAREHLLLALLEEPSTVGPVLRSAGLEPYTALQELLRQRETE